jgi:small subunit ribosomal protein S16
MSVKIRLRRTGRKKMAHYRIVVAESSFPRDGRFIETLGYYKPMENPARLILDLEKVDEWLAKGAVQSETVRTLVNRARKGGDATVAMGELDPKEASNLKATALEERRKKERAKKAAEEAAEEAAAALEAEEAKKAAEEAAAALETEEAKKAAEEAPVEEAPVEEAPAEEAPVEEAPVEEAPVEEAPVEEAPVEEAPAEEAPVEEAPAEEEK